MSTKHMFIRLYKSNYSGCSYMGIDSSLIKFLMYFFFLIPLVTVNEFDLGT